MDEKKINMDQDAVQNDAVSDKNGAGNGTVVPAMTQGSVVVFPYALTPLVLDNPENIHLVEEASATERLVVIFPGVPDQEDKHTEVQGIE